MNVNPREEDILRDYLLGAVSPDVRERVEARIFSEDSLFWERTCLAEDELIDDYVRNALDRDAALSFEQVFLSTEDRKRKLEFVRALKRYVDDESRSQWARPAKLLQQANALHSFASTPIWAMAAVVAVLSLVPAASWWFAVSRQPAVVSTSLSSGAVRSANQVQARVRIPPDSAIVRLRLETDVDESETYGVSLHEVAGDLIWSQNKLAPRRVDGRTEIVVSIPTDVLVNGDYYVRLYKGPAGKESVALDRFDFRVLR